MKYLETFVDAAENRFVAIIWTVGDFIADQTFVNTLGAVCTFELSIRTGSHRSASTFSSGVGTIPFVRPVAAIVFLVAVIRFGHTFSVLASEFRRRASAVFAVTFGSFVRSVTTIVIVITRPVAVDTAAVTASKLFGRAAVASRTIERSGILISSVDTIRITITNPFTRNTLSFACKEIEMVKQNSSIFPIEIFSHLPHCLLALHENSVSESHFRLPH